MSGQHITILLIMLGRVGFAVLALCLVIAMARPKGSNKMRKDIRRKDMAIRSRNHGFERPVQGNFLLGYCGLLSIYRVSQKNMD